MNKKYFILISIIFIFMGNVFAQTSSYTNEGFITIAPDTPFPQAISTLEILAQTYKSSKIMNMSSYTGVIGVPVNQVLWENALDLIVNYNNLVLEELPGTYIVKDRKIKQTKLETAEVKINSRQIKISSVFFTADRSLLNNLGIDWSTIVNGKVASSAHFSGGERVAGEIFEGAVTKSFSSGNFLLDVNALIRIIERNEMGEIIARPNVTVLSGKEGFLQVGKDFSIRSRDFQGNVREQFYNTGVILKVTPVILEDSVNQAIHLITDIERSDVIPGEITTIVNKSSSKTEVLLYDGEETVIGGLFTKEKTIVRSGVPILKDLPWWVLGIRYLTGYDKTESNEKEMIIILKAEIMDIAINRKIADKISLKNQIELARLKFNEDQTLFVNSGKNHIETKSKPVDAPFEVVPQKEDDVDQISVIAEKEIVELDIVEDKYPETIDSQTSIKEDKEIPELELVEQTYPETIDSQTDIENDTKNLIETEEKYIETPISTPPIEEPSELVIEETNEVAVEQMIEPMVEEIPEVANEEVIEPVIEETNEVAVEEIIEPVIEKIVIQKPLDTQKIVLSNNTVVFDDIYFDMNEWKQPSKEFNTDYEKNIYQAAICLKKYKKLNILLRGYSDTTGSKVYNEYLAQRRCETIGNAILDNFSETERKFYQDKIYVKSFGENSLLNRRVTINLAGSPDGKKLYNKNTGNNIKESIPKENIDQENYSNLNYEYIEDIMVLYKLGLSSYNKDKKDEAKNIFSKIIELDHIHPLVDNAQWWIGEIYFKNKEYEIALVNYAKVSEFGDGNKSPYAHYRMGSCYWHLDQTEKAIDILQEVSIKYPLAIEEIKKANILIDIIQNKEIENE